MNRENNSQIRVKNLAPEQEKKLQRKFEEGMKKIAKLQHNKVMQCYKSNSDSMKGFVNCYKGFHKKAEDLGPVTEQRMNWCIYKFGQCRNSGKKKFIL